MDPRYKIILQEDKSHSLAIYNDWSQGKIEKTLSEILRVTRYYGYSAHKALKQKTGLALLPNVDLL